MGFSLGEKAGVVLRRRFVLVVVAAWILASCVSPAADHPDETARVDETVPTPPATFVPLVAEKTTAQLQGSEQPPATPVASPVFEVSECDWDVYHPDPAHLWNRLFCQLYRRMGSDGREYGRGELDPLLWYETRYLLEGDSHARAVALLDEFLEENGEALVDVPLRRAVFQRDLWAVYDWLGLQITGYPGESQALRARISQAMRRIALTEEEIRSLPDNYRDAIHAQTYPGEFQAESPGAPFLPAELFDPHEAWVNVGREVGPLAMTHTEEYPFFGRSVFLVFIRVPGGRADTLDFIALLNSSRHPEAPPGTEVALARRMLHVAQGGEIVLTPILESLQIRHFTTGFSQVFYEFKLDREGLFSGQRGALLPVEEEFPLFRSHGVDWFESGVMEDGARLHVVPATCKGCHDDEGIGIRGAQSILSYSRARFPLPDEVLTVLSATTPEREAQLVVAWKHDHRAWWDLKRHWNP